MAVRYKTGATPTTPEQKTEFAATARKTVLDDLNPILTKLTIKHEVVTATQLRMDPVNGLLEVRFPQLDTGDFLCEIAFALPIARTGNRWNRNDEGGTCHTGAIHYKTMTGPSNRYFAGNFKNWGKARLPEIEEYLESFITTAKLFHKQRTSAVTLVPRLRAALERRSVPGGCTSKVTVEAGYKGHIQTIERMLTHKNYYTKETYLYNEEENTMILNSSTSSGLLSDPFSF
jgi:hypothetical protein